MNCTLLSDKRPIVGLYFANEGSFRVGEHGVLKIELCPVAGNGGYYAWFRVTCKDRPPILWNGIHVEGVEHGIDPEPPAPDGKD